ncbi:MAG: N-acetyl sugar amidotransferase [Bacteroidetes bacterium]|nr:N-acetyl sugar amidotransferase [Bacteroidota bacterium]
MINQTCTRCVMDTSDPGIIFDQQGVCDNCHTFDSVVRPNWFPDDRGKPALKLMLDKVKDYGKNREYDCIMGMSGGLDSSYLLHQAVAVHGLRPLVFHVDAGWNTELAVNNIKNLVDKLELDLFTEVIDWDDMKEFQLALFKSGTPHLDLAQDHAFFATMYHYAKKYDIKYILNGGNHSTECIRNPLMWLYYGTDMAFLNDIRDKFCETGLVNYPWSGIFYHKLYLRYIKGIEVLKPLNLMEYNKKIAIDTLSKIYNWKPYPQKHFESRFTRFYESYWLPSRFGYDTRKVQFSSLIVTGQLTREEAMKALETAPYTDAYAKDEFEYVANKLDINREALKSYHTMPKKWFTDYKNSKWIFDVGAKFLNILNKDKAAIKR